MSIAISFKARFKLGDEVEVFTAAYAVGRDFPMLQCGVDVQWRVSEVDLRTGVFAMETGGQHLIAKREGSFEDSCGPCGHFWRMGQ